MWFEGWGGGMEERAVDPLVGLGGEEGEEGCHHTPARRGWMPRCGREVRGVQYLLQYNIVLLPLTTSFVRNY